MNKTELTTFLLESRLVDPRSIVDGDFTVTDASRRNRNYKVAKRDGQSYLVKHGLDRNRAQTIDREARLYGFLNSAEATEFADYLPGVCGYAADRSLLVLELLADGQDLREYQAGRKRFSTLLARSIGKALRTLHRIDPPRWLEPDPPEGPPWPLAVHQPTIELLRTGSAATTEVTKVVQGSKRFCARLDELRSGWQATALVHGDLRWDNCVAVPPPLASRKTRIKIVDWESAGVGDPYWDVGSVFADYLATWLLSIPVTGPEPPEHFVKLAGTPLVTMHRAIREFAGAYRGHAQTAAPQGWLVQSVRYSGARLLQTCYEQAQSQGRVTGPMVCMLQMAYNVLDRPEDAATQLLGLPVLDFD